MQKTSKNSDVKEQWEGAEKALGEPQAGKPPLSSPPLHGIPLFLQVRQSVGVSGMLPQTPGMVGGPLGVTLWEETGEKQKGRAKLDNLRSVSLEGVPH